MIHCGDNCDAIAPDVRPLTIRPVLPWAIAAWSLYTAGVALLMPTKTDNSTSSIPIDC